MATFQIPVCHKVDSFYLEFTRRRVFKTEIVYSMHYLLFPSLRDTIAGTGVPGK